VFYAIGSDLSIFMRTEAASLHHAGGPPPATPLINFYKSADGLWVCLMPKNLLGDWSKIATAAGRADLIDDPRFKTDRNRRDNTPELVSLLDAAFGALPFDELTRRFIEADLAWAPIQTPAQLVEDPQAQAAGLLRRNPRRPTAASSPRQPCPPASPGTDDGPKGAAAKPGAAHGSGVGRSRLRRRGDCRDASQRGGCVSGSLVRYLL